MERRHSNPKFNPTDSEGKIIPEKARFSPENGDVLEVRPGTRTYGEARRMEHEICVKEKTYIGREEGNYAGNRDYPMDAAKFEKYDAPDAC